MVALAALEDVAEQGHGPALRVDRQRDAAALAGAVLCDALGVEGRAAVALQYLTSTQGQLDQTQSRINSGLKVANARDDGAMPDARRCGAGDGDLEQLVSDPDGIDLLKLTEREPWKAADVLGAEFAEQSRGVEAAAGTPAPPGPAFFIGAPGAWRYKEPLQGRPPRSRCER